MLQGLLVDIGRSVVLLLVDLVADGILGGRCTGMLLVYMMGDSHVESLPSADVCGVVLGDLLVGLLGCSASGTLDGVGDVVGGVLNLVHVDGWIG